MNKNLNQIIDDIAVQGRKAALELQNASAQQINSALKNMASLLENEAENLKIENQKDLVAARNKGLSPAMVDRLTLSDKTIQAMINGLYEVAQLNSPVGTVFDQRQRPNGTIIYKMKVPIGVVGIIYESRPNVTVDAAAICLKSHNAVILRGGSEAINSNMALAALFSKAILSAGLPGNSVQIISTTDREAIELMLTKNEYIDLIIPRGGEGLIRMVTEKSHIPVIKHYNGICHIYVAADADIKKALPVIINAKVQRPGTCNAMEKLLLDSDLPFESRSVIIEELLKNGVTIFGDPETMKLSAAIKQATAKDWKTEYLNLSLTVGTVNGLKQAIDHINTFGSHHTDSILTQSEKTAQSFVKQVDSASVMVNTSTRLADGAEYGMGCEIGISTDKLHARGPMGVEDLTTYKWVVKGDGQIRG
ncbi:MAG TPA: glutamate-5-semialdehyde dehydrogenase [Chitinispirillaceae bacterium]|nr:glutamate-5-semialdehyde dehydrogenase [Chitinispirillaceae bacterium]